MQRFLKKKALYALLYAVTAILLEVISFSVMGLGAFPAYWGLDFAFIFGIALLIFILPWEIPV